MPSQRTLKKTAASSRPGARSRTKDEPIGKISKAKPGTGWNRLRSRSGAQIRRAIAADPDAHATDAAFWKHATVVMPTPKSILTMRLDADLLSWFRQQPGYQTRINAILRAYMQAHS
jgi:uncharacterized protein (DUF4415 family)